MPIARIKTDRVIRRGEKYRKITGFEGVLGEKDLPREYFAKIGPAEIRGGMTFQYAKRLFFALDGLDTIYFDPGVELPLCNSGCNCRSYRLRIGDEIREEVFQEIIVWFRRAGARLGKINMRLAKENAGWCGEEVVEI